MKRQQPSGVLLLLALVMMALVLSAALVLGTVIVRELRLAQVSDKGITAFYASETAAEDAVYRMFKLGEQAVDLATSGSLSGGSSWTRLAKQTDSEFVFDFIAKDETVVVNLYNTGETNQAAQVESFSMEWTSGQTLELAVSEWDGSTLATPTSQNCVSSPCFSNTPRFDKAYYVTITARGSAVTDLIVSAYSGDGATGTPVGVEIPVTVVATGEYKGAQQAVELRLPVPAPWEGTPVPPPTQTCGNGVTEGTETCDDNNTNNGDGCSATCQIEVPSAVCGNGTVETGETCDDSNTANGDGCSSTCQTEVPACGDGNIDAGETCDDSNTANGDGCSSTCQNEAAPVLTTIIVSPNPASPTFTAGSVNLERVQFSAQGKDQYGNDIAIIPAPTWTRLTGLGGINSSTGQYVTTTGDTTFSVRATSGSITGDASGAVVCPPCTDLNLAGLNAPVDGFWTGGYVNFSRYPMTNARCSGAYYTNSFSVVTPITATCNNTYPINNCAGYYTAQPPVVQIFSDSYGWGVTNVGRYSKNDGSTWPTVIFNQGAVRFCKP